MKVFAKVEPIRFGDFEAMPEKMTTETKLRLQNLKFDTETQIQEAMNLLADCFGAQTQQVKEFMEGNMFVNDLVDLQIYLTQGPQSYADMKESYKKALDYNLMESMKKGQDEAA